MSEDVRENESGLREQLHDLEERFEAVRRIKHQISNELMGVLGHTDLLLTHRDLSDKALERARKIREHCDNLQYQAAELNRVLVR